MVRISSLYISILIALFSLLFVNQAEGKDFVVVIDAGHGGKDPGAKGKSINEKTINLSVAQKLGSLISQNHKDVKVVYTRKTDVFVDLDERANIANRNKADLFISIHTNAVKRGSAVAGTETYTLGLARTDENLEVAMRENSAILLEDNYLQKYEGFDPNSSESYIIFEFMQNKHMEQSISLASEVQKSFVSAKRKNRGVRQAGFLVLRKTGMPSILVELGYISNPAEEQFMKGAEGQRRLATAIYNAFTKYKREYDRKKGGVSGNVFTAPLIEIKEENNQVEPVEAPKNEAKTVTKKVGEKTSSSKELKGVVIYKIQILTSDKKLSANSKLFKGYKNVDYFVEKGIYKYTYGEMSDLNAIRKLRRQVARDFKDAFIVAFKDGEKVKY
ncbi:MAG: N-acetylmuramoyl-L-alanine amidase [Parabacteroides sp.]|nr:N-acetylmuramoyl-L-alanine amidase [Parabacteroides sp.]